MEPHDFLYEKIHYLRGHKVMLDRDLAELYGVETKRINEQAKRNSARFPDDFMFRLTQEEYRNLRSQFATTKWGGDRYLPYAFTEHGILMLSSVLNSERAIQTNILIMRIFTKMRTMLLEHADVRLEIEKIRSRVENQSRNIELLFEYVDELTRQPPESDRPAIGYRK
ncbi:MAG TPA: ORF6N domain-containing protein [Flavobacterium sp.]|nr:ORF6N domain-containing protein [Flavobacterium sp.]